MNGCPAAIAIVDGEPVLCLSDQTDPQLVGALARLFANVDVRCAVPTCGFDENTAAKVAPA